MSLPLRNALNNSLFNSLQSIEPFRRNTIITSTDTRALRIRSANILITLLTIQGRQMTFRNLMHLGRISNISLQIGDVSADDDEGVHRERSTDQDEGHDGFSCSVEDLACFEEGGSVSGYFEAVSGVVEEVIDCMGYD